MGKLTSVIEALAEAPGDTELLGSTLKALRITLRRTRLSEDGKQVSTYSHSTSTKCLTMFFIK